MDSVLLGGIQDVSSFFCVWGGQIWKPYNFVVLPKIPGLYEIPKLEKFEFLLLYSVLSRGGQDL